MACPHRDDVGPWVLGALGGDDERVFAEHLAGCAECTADVAQLKMVADALPMAAPQVVPPPALKARIMGAVESEAALLRAAGPEADRPARAERGQGRFARWLAPLGRLRPVPAAALATVILAVGVLVGVLASGGDDTSTTRGFAPQGAQVALHVTGDHGRLDFTGMPAPPAGRVYQVWLVHGDRAPRPTHTLFTVAHDGRAQVDILESLKGTDKVLVTDEPAGGSRAPTTQPVAGATLT